jgi:DNA-binding winged helix-turn-helix (wHTH) protein/tetratricopeptide (TPR) repeat protein
MSQAVQQSVRPAPTPDGWFFDHYHLDLRARELRLSDGSRLPLEAKAFDLLALLIAERDRAIDKQELLERVWHGRVVAEGSLTQAVFKLRRLLGETDAASSRIRTVHGHGLQWVGSVSSHALADSEPVPALPAPVPVGSGTRSIRSWLAAGSLLAVAAIALVLVTRPHKPKLAILPAALEQPDQRLAWVPAGVQGLLIGLLGDQKIDTRATASSPEATRLVSDHTVDALAHLQTASGTDFLLSEALSAKGPLFELQLRLFSGGHAIWTDTLVGEQPGALAVDAAARVRKRLGLDEIPQAISLKDATPYIAETYARGVAEMAAGHTQAAIDFFRICANNAPLQRWPRVKLADALRQVGQAAEGRAIAMELIAQSDSAADAVLQNELLRTRGRLELQLNNLASAQTDLQNAFADAESHAWRGAQWQSRLGLGLVARARGQFDSAQREFQSLITEIEASGEDRSLLAEVYNALGGVYADAGQLDQATATDLHALDLYRQIDQRNGELLVERNVATMFGMRWRALDALPLALDAAASTQPLQDKHLQIWADTSLADSLAVLHAYPAAHAYAAHAVTLANQESAPGTVEESVNTADRAQALFVLGFVDAQAQRHDEAATSLNEAATLNARSGSVVWASWSLWQAASNALARGRRAEAEQDSRQLFDLADTLEAQQLAPDSRNALRAVAILSRAELQATAGDIAGAAADFAAAFKLTDNIRYQQFIRLHWAKLSVAAGRTDGVAELIDQLAAWREQSADVRQLEIDFARLQGRPTADLQTGLDRLLASPVLAAAIAAAPKSASSRSPTQD